MSTFEMLYLGLVIFAMVAFAATLSFVTYEGKVKREAPAAHPHGKAAHAGAH